MYNNNNNSKHSNNVKNSLGGKWFIFSPGLCQPGFSQELEILVPRTGWPSGKQSRYSSRSGLDIIYPGIGQRLGGM